MDNTELIFKIIMLFRNFLGFALKELILSHFKIISVSKISFYKNIKLQIADFSIKSKRLIIKTLKERSQIGTLRNTSNNARPRAVRSLREVSNQGASWDQFYQDQASGFATIKWWGRQSKALDNKSYQNSSYHSRIIKFLLPSLS